MPRFSPPRSQSIEQSKTNDRLSNVIDSLAPPATYPLIVDPRVNAKAGAFLRLAPRAAGQQLIVPAASSGNFAQLITVFVKNSLGVLRVRAASGTINGQTALTFGIGTTAIIVLVSDGETGWATTVALGALPDIPAGTVIGNPVDGADPGPPVALTGTQLGRILQFNTGASLSLGAGNFPAVVLPDANVIRLTHGGNVAVVQGIVAPARPGQIIILGSTSGGGDETIFLDEDAAAAAANRIRTPGGVPYSIRSGDYGMMMYVDLGSTDRWVIFGQPSNMYAQNEQTQSGSGPHDLVLSPGVSRVTFSGSNVVVNSITGGTDTSRLVMVYFTGSGIHTVNNQGNGVGNEANIFFPNDAARRFGPRGSFLMQANGTAGWRAHYPIHGAEVITYARRTAITTVTNATTAIIAATLSIPANTVVNGDTYRMRCQYLYNRGATATASNLTLQMRVNAAAQISSGGLATQTVNPSAGTIQMDVIVSFLGTPGATCAYTLAGKMIYFGLTATPTVVIHQLPVPSIALTVDTTAAITLDFSAALSVGVANLSLTCMQGTIEKM